MRRSIRWALLAWNAILILGVLVGLGSTAYFRLRRSAVEEVDADLLRLAQLVASDLAHSDGGAIEVPAELQARGRRGEKEGPGDRYFAIWSSGGILTQVSNPGLAPSLPEPRRKPERRRHPWQHRDRGRFREVVLDGPLGSTVLVGRSLEGELSRLRSFLGWLVGSGAGVLGLGIAGSWWIARSVLRPVEAMTAAAASISASNLSRRIDVRSTTSELGQLAGVLNAMFDRLQAAFSQQARFTADASHELRTPLSVIQAQTDLALARDRSVEEYRRALEACRRACGRMASVAEDLMALARADAGRLVGDRRRIDLSRIVTECIELSSSLLEPKGLRWELDVEPVEIVGDATRIARAVRNVVENAVLYNRPGGAVTVTLRADGSDAVLVVADTGAGISASDLPHVCERFFRGDSSRSRDVGGSGLGLSLVKEIVEAHGGRLALTSEEDRGTTVTLRIPRTADAAEGASSA